MEMHKLVEHPDDWGPLRCLLFASRSYWNKITYVTQTHVH
jgi:hypothetical protein